MHNLNHYVRFKRREKEILNALRIYASTIGCINIEGRYWTVYEYNPGTDQISIAKILPVKYPTMESVIKKDGCLYVKAYDVSQVKKLLGI